jgi:two-component system, LytTR family, response regulator LytT
MNNPLKIVIVEDEMIIAESIFQSLKSLNYNAIEPVANYTSALELIAGEKPDLVLIDIRLSGSKDGIDLANEINSIHAIPFIFLTSNSDPSTIERAKKTHPAAYLLKPFSKADLYSTIEISLQNYNKLKELRTEKSVPMNDFIMVKQNKNFVKVLFNEILYINSQHIYVEIVTASEKRYLVRTTLNEYMKLLPPYFLKVHRSYVINVHYIDEIITQSVILKGVTIPVSKEFRKDLAEVLNKK